MYLALIGADHKTAQIELRETISMTHSATSTALVTLKQSGTVLGSVILSTCNRTELYGAFAQRPTVQHLESLFCQITGAPLAALQPHFYWKRDTALKTYLFELACGLHSMILGEDQIITQVGDALALSMNAQAGCSVLNTLFRHAVTSAKKAKTTVVLRQVSPSIVSLALKKMGSYFTSKPSPFVLVIGNGEMGRLAAKAFLRAGCRVCMTLRSYKYAATVIPEGCTVIPYEQRCTLLTQADIVVSATKSPHHTLSYAMLSPLKKRPDYMIDLALPRDIDPKIQTLPHVQCLDVDSIGGSSSSHTPEQLEVRRIIEQQLVKFEDWNSYSRQQSI